MALSPVLRIGAPDYTLLYKYAGNGLFVLINSHSTYAQLQTRKTVIIANYPLNSLLWLSCARHPTVQDRKSRRSPKSLDMLTIEICAAAEVVVL